MSHSLMALSSLMSPLAADGWSTSVNHAAIVVTLAIKVAIELMIIMLLVSIAVS